MCALQAIIIEEWDDDIATCMYMCKNPALSSHSQWFTLAQRILCLDVHTARPCFALRRLTTAVIKFYAQSWLRIKCHLHVHVLCTDGP